MNQKSKSIINDKSSKVNLTEKFASALLAAQIEILKYDPSIVKCIITTTTKLNIEKFFQLLISKLGARAIEFPEIYPTFHNPIAALELIEEYAEEKGIVVRSEKAPIEIPQDMVGLNLYFNMSAKGKEERFFLADKNHRRVRISGDAYLLAHQLSPTDAVECATAVIPDYMPRGPIGVSITTNGNRNETTFNTYARPSWDDHPDWHDLPDKLPAEFEMLINHLFPIIDERKYFYSWLHHSLFKRAYVYLVLCGPPGTGKNRLKLIMRALHGHDNAVDGKKSSLVERFNSQLTESTMAWFDELRYDEAMENTMKELQNDTISIERKSVDATRATKIHASIVISNNKPRDNHIPFDARKFAALKITDKRLEESMSVEQIDRLTQKVEDAKSKKFDSKFLAQIAKWIKRRGASEKWKNLEYKGPMFWTLAHTSMTQWQKKAVMSVLDKKTYRTHSGYDFKREAFLWSETQAKENRKGGNSNPTDFTSVKAFFETFRDSEGRKAFTTESVPGINLLGDFWVKPILKDIKITTEAEVIAKRGGLDAKAKKITFDL